MKEYDVIIIGSGPAGIFAGLELAGTGLRTLILEKGRDIVARSCPISHHNGKCLRCKPCDILCGWGGAGAGHGAGKGAGNEFSFHWIIRLTTHFVLAFVDGGA